MSVQPEQASKASSTSQTQSTKSQNIKATSNDLLADLTGPSPSSTPAAAPVNVGKASPAPPSFTSSNSTAKVGGELFDLVTPQPGSSTSAPVAKQPAQAPGSSKADILALFSSPAPVQQQRPQSQAFGNFSAPPPQAQPQQNHSQMNTLGGGMASMNLGNAQTSQQPADPWGSFGQDSLPSQPQQSSSAQHNQQQSGFGSFTSSAPASNSSSSFSDLFSSQDVWNSGPPTSSNKTSNANHDIWGDFK